MRSSRVIFAMAAVVLGISAVIAIVAGTDNRDSSDQQDVTIVSMATLTPVTGAGTPCEETLQVYRSRRTKSDTQNFSCTRGDCYHNPNARLFRLSRRQQYNVRRAPGGRLPYDLLRLCSGLLPGLSC